MHGRSALRRAERGEPNALERFLAKCRFDPQTACVVWCGGKTRGRGKTSWYGSFWFEGKRWLAHRWAAKYLLGLEIDGLEVDHECGNTLCMRHLAAVTGRVNTALYWVRIEVGLDELPLDGRVWDDAGIPFHVPPIWLPMLPAPLDPPF